MMAFRVLWALILAALTAFAFRRSHRWEHGAPMPRPILGGDKPRSKETAVWLDPAFLPVLLLLILLLFAAADGKDGVARFLSLSLDVMIVISVYFVLLILLLPLFRRYFSARACATMWILPVFMFWQAHILLQYAPAPTFVIYIPSNLLRVLFSLWAAGFLVVFAGKFISHFLFRRRLLSAAVSVKDPKVLALFDCELKRLEYYHPVSLVISPAAAVPLSMGSRKHNRVTVLPNRDFSEQELQFIFRHEIHHLQRGDVSNKVFFAFCQALCWFNPLIWVATRKAADDLELSCDEIVLEDMDEGLRKQYAALLLDTAGQSGGFTTCLSAAAETMRYRLKNVVTVRSRRPGTILLSIAMFLCVMSYGIIAVSSDKGTAAELITTDRAAEDIRSVFYRSEGESNLRGVFAWDGEALFSYLTSLEVERLTSANEIHALGDRCAAVVIGEQKTIQLMIYDTFIEVYHFYHGGHAEYYHLRSRPDWDRITECLDFDAERPVEPTLLWPELRIYFDAPQQEEPLFAVRSKLRVWDTETGETLRDYVSSDSPGGLYGAAPTQAQLVFDMSVSEVTIWRYDPDSDSRTAAAFEMEDVCCFLPLDSRSAHYQVDVVYEPQEGIGYEAVYVFRVEYPNPIDTGDAPATTP